MSVAVSSYRDRGLFAQVVHATRRVIAHRVTAACTTRGSTGGASAGSAVRSRVTPDGHVVVGPRGSIPRQRQLARSLLCSSIVQWDPERPFHCSVDGTDFTVAVFADWFPPRDGWVISKTREMIERLEAVVLQLQPRRIVELGVAARGQHRVPRDTRKTGTSDRDRTRCRAHRRARSVPVRRSVLRNRPGRSRNPRSGCRRRATRSRCRRRVASARSDPCLVQHPVPATPSRWPLHHRGLGVGPCGLPHRGGGHTLAIDSGGRATDPFGHRTLDDVWFAE